MDYVGRFAPSPTGPLHFGSLVAALASYLDARSHSGKWLVRMEDLDAPRCIPGAAGNILETLELFGFEWDGAVLRQSARGEAYADALAQLRERSLVYPCTCSRKEAGHHVYPGTCRHRATPPNQPHAWRVRVSNGETSFIDRSMGCYTQDLARDAGDFPLLRADGLFTYQLAVVVDDAAQGVTHVVRGADLLDSTPRQIYLQRLLGYRTPQYLHVPLATNAAGEKLSKQTLAPAIDPTQAPQQLVEAARFLGLPTPPDLAGSAPREILAELTGRWYASRGSGRVPG